MNMLIKTLLLLAVLACTSEGIRSKRAFDSLTGQGFGGFNKRAFDSFGQSFGGLEKRAFDSLAGSGFGAFNKRAFDSFGQSFGGLHKRAFDSLTDSGFGDFTKRNFESLIPVDRYYKRAAIFHPARFFRLRRAFDTVSSSGLVDF